MRYLQRKIGYGPGVLFVLCGLVLLSGCEVVEERRASIINAVDELSDSASGALSTARSGVESAVDAGTIVVGTVRETAGSITDRVGKIRRGAELIREGVTGEGGGESE